MKSLIFYCLPVMVQIQLTFTYQLTKIDPGVVSVSPGESVSMLCGVDAHWEYCKFTGPAAQECDFEWKRLYNGVRMQKCDISSRAEFFGRYNDKECGIILNNAQPEDSGIWSCEVEEYIFLGNRGSGNTVYGKINLTVQATTTEKTFTTPLEQEVETLNKETEVINKETVMYPSTTTDTEESTQDVTTERKQTVSTSEQNTIEETTEDVQNNSILVDPNTKFNQDNGEDDPEETPEAVPRIEEANSNLSAVIGVICAVALIGVVGVAAMAFRKRQLARQRPDAAAAVVYDREARSANDERNMVSGQQQAGTTSSQTRKPESNYHEFFPPNLTGQGATTTYNSV